MLTTLIDDKVNTYKIILAEIPAFISLIDASFKNMYEHVTEINAKMTLVQTKPMLVQKSTSVQIKSLFVTLNATYKLDVDIADIITAINNIPMDTETIYLSNTQLLAAIEAREILLAKYYIIMDKIAIINNDILISASTAIATNTLKDVHTAFMDNLYTIDVYCEFMSKQNPDIAKPYIEIAKDTVMLDLAPQFPPEIDNRNGITIQYNSIKLSVIITRVIHQTSTVETIDQFTKLLLAKNIGVYSLSAVDVEYNINYLINKTIAKTIPTKSTDGIGPNIMKKYNTIKVLALPTTGGGPEKFPDIPFDEATMRYIIIRPNGLRYDVFGFDKSILVSRGIIETMRRRASGRVHSYQYLKTVELNKFIIPLYVMPPVLVVSPIGPLSTAIQAKLINFMDAMIKDNPPKSIKDIGKIIEDSKLLSIIATDILIAFGVMDLDINVKPTALAHASVFTSKILRNISELFAKTVINDNIFHNKTDKGLYKYITEILHTAISTIITRMFSADQDIFEAINTRKLLSF